MHRSIEIVQIVARAINRTTWYIPKIRDGDSWRNIRNAHLVENAAHLNDYDRFEGSIDRIKTIMESRGWQVSLAYEIEPCHEHLYYQCYRLLCRR